MNDESNNKKNDSRSPSSDSVFQFVWGLPDDYYRLKNKMLTEQQKKAGSEPTAGPNQPDKEAVDVITQLYSYAEQSDIPNKQEQKK